jgi:hypothetical protein
MGHGFTQIREEKRKAAHEFNTKKNTKKRRE